MSAFQITKFERLAAEEPTVALALGGIKVGGRQAGFAADVEIEVPGESGVRTVQLGVSKLDGETQWIVDFYALEGAGVRWANGQGARYCKLKAVTDDEIVAALEAAATEGHDCQENAVPYESDGAIGHGWECGVCGRFLQAG